MLKVDTRELHMLLRTFADAGPEIRKGVAEQSKRGAPMLVRAAQSHARGEVEKRIAQSARTKVTAKGFVATFGSTGKLSGGAKLGEVTRPYEFGTHSRETFTTYRSRSRSGRAIKVTRRTTRQIPTPHVKSGRFLHPAVADMAPALLGRYIGEIQAVMYGE